MSGKEKNNLFVVDITCIDRIAEEMISDMLAELYEWSGKEENNENIRLVSLGEIRGITQLADTLKREITNDPQP